MYMFCCGSILSLVEILFSFVSNHYHTLSYPKTKENKISTKDKIEPQHIHITAMFYPQVQSFCSQQSELMISRLLKLKT